MPVTVATTYADSVAEVCSSTAASLMTVEAMVHPSNTATVFVQFFDAAAPTLGTDAPLATLPLRHFAVQGRKTKNKYVIPGGVICTSALSFFVTNGSVANTTAAAGTNAPQEVRVFWRPA